MVRPQVHSTKHFVPFAIDQVGAGLVQNTVLISANAVVDKNLATEIEEGNSIKAIYIELWLQNQGNLGEFIATVSKQTEFDNGPTFTEMANLNAYSNKKNVLYTTQGLTSNDGVSGPVNVLRNWIKVPKSKQRFGLGDVLSLSISNVSANDLNRCGISIFKEYS